MAKKKACKKCRIITNAEECPLCKSNDLTTNIKGRVVIIDATKSEIAQKLNIKVKGEYAIKTK
ncbi:DNA-directed RNA polymerase subunit E'' [Candidatus Woesearchaeota archaeon]|nr:DNA-directed RNA polymerase subunit E'' [Candidatus Woesearchaeota archaeon]